MKHPEDLLTEPQLAALRLAAAGCTVSQIARRLAISDSSAARRLELARRRLGAQNTTHAVVVAAASGVLARADIQAAMAARRPVREEKD